MVYNQPKSASHTEVSLKFTFIKDSARHNINLQYHQQNQEPNIMVITPWTPNEDVILLSLMEDSDNPPPDLEIQVSLPRHTLAGIQDHYREICTQELDLDDYTALQTSWNLSVTPIF